MDVKYIADMFAAGAYSTVARSGMSDGEARAFTASVCKQAAAQSVMRDEDDEDTWWNRNRGWAMPSAIALAAFLLGSETGRIGRLDRGYLSDAGNRMWDRVKALLGSTDNPVVKGFTEARKVPKRQENPYIPNMHALDGKE